MNAFEARAIENITTAPATSLDRRAALVGSGILVALLGATIPFANVRLPVTPSFVPAVTGAAILALVLTSVLLYVQYRIERDLKLALLAIGYGFTALMTLFYLLTFPGVFAANGLLGANAHTAAWAYVATQNVFAWFVILEGIADKRDWRAPAFAVRRITLVTAVAFVAFVLLATWFNRFLPPSMFGMTANPAWRAVVAPVTIAALLAAMALQLTGARTVIQVWLSVVLLARLTEVVTVLVLTGQRFTVGWYLARVEDLIAASIIVAVFLLKINALMLRLAERSRTTAEALAVGEARYGALANVVPQLIWTADPEGGIEYVNDRWTTFTGYDAQATRDGGWRNTVHPEQERFVLDRWQHALRSGDPFNAEYRIREGATGRYRWYLVNAVPVRNRRGDVVTWIGTCTDVDAQKRLEEREAFLSRAGERLGSSLDVTATVATIKQLAIPRIAERTWIALVDENGRYILTGIGSTEIADELDTRRWIGAPLQPALHDAVARVVELGDAVVLDKPDRFPDPWLRELPAGAAMLVPLISGETTIGALALVRTSGRAYDADDVALVREFARRASLSLEHARLYERERTTADALQRAMLPTQLPQLSGVRFSAEYSAASESQRVGGDFYDAFELPDGRVAVTIGDVTGHGLEAAVVMGEIRQAIRAASFEAAEPSAILDRASRLLIASGRSLFVTAIFGVIDLSTGRFAYATAGHPPPLVDRGGDLQRLASSGLPIGLRDEQGVDFALRLHAPCTLVLYTDGLLEFARDIADGERRIEAAMRVLANEKVEHLATALMKAVLGEDEPSDDIAILTVTIDRFGSYVPGDEREWIFSSDDALTAAMVRRDVGALAAHWTGRDDATFAGELAFGELLSNAVRHAPGPLWVRIASDGKHNVTLTVEDSGLGDAFVRSPSALDPLAEHGRGLALV
ncbi:MAG: SpoIIE family protein phosphatase, partial [Candidatus Eremiobacteraeota bacterium]|nr:SpoIIE family protein phosphatase [Candidatus Eremiobacteraeota bacterium]